jgi:ribonuclease HI
VARGASRSAPLDLRRSLLVAPVRLVRALSRRAARWIVRTQPGRGWDSEQRRWSCGINTVSLTAVSFSRAWCPPLSLLRASPLLAGRSPPPGKNVPRADRGRAGVDESRTASSHTRRVFMQAFKRITSRTLAAHRLLPTLSSSSSMGKKNFYAVRSGRRPGIYTNWPDCQAQTQGFPRASFRGFTTRREAEEFMGESGSQVGASQAAAAAASYASAPFRSYDAPSSRPAAAAAARAVIDLDAEDDAAEAADRQRMSDAYAFLDFGGESYAEDEMAARMAGAYHYHNEPYYQDLSSDDECTPSPAAPAPSQWAPGRQSAGAAAASSSSSAAANARPPSQAQAQAHQHRAHPYQRQQARGLHSRSSLQAEENQAPAAAAPSSSRPSAVEVAAQIAASRAAASSTTPAASSASSSSAATVILPRHGVLYCDGAAKGNPLGPIGCGGLLYSSSPASSSTPSACLGTFKRYLGPRGTNNEAEYAGLLQGMELALQHGVTHLTVKMDSELIAKQMTGEYKVRAENLQPLYSQALQLASRFQRCDVQHIYREENSLADELANQAIAERR